MMARQVLNYSNAWRGPFGNRASLGVRRGKVCGRPDDRSAGQVVKVDAGIRDHLSPVFGYIAPPGAALAASA
jgi:hypothetical protein